MSIRKWTALPLAALLILLPAGCADQPAEQPRGSEYAHIAEFCSPQLLDKLRAGEASEDAIEAACWGFAYIPLYQQRNLLGAGQVEQLPRMVDVEVVLSEATHIYEPAGTAIRVEGRPLEIRLLPDPDSMELVREQYPLPLTNTRAMLHSFDLQEGWLTNAGNRPLLVAVYENGVLLEAASLRAFEPDDPREQEQWLLKAAISAKAWRQESTAELELLRLEGRIQTLGPGKGFFISWEGNPGADGRQWVIELTGLTAGGELQTLYGPVDKVDGYHPIETALYSRLTLHATVTDRTGATASRDIDLLQLLSDLSNQ